MPGRFTRRSSGAWYEDVAKRLERATGVEPATSSLGSWHSTTELRPLTSSAGSQNLWNCRLLVNARST
jgi:hypothetical protein